MSMREADPFTLNVINAEIVRSRTMYPGRAHMLKALLEEMGELAGALEQGDHDAAWSEASQVAAIAARIMEEGDAEFPQADK